MYLIRRAGKIHYPTMISHFRRMSTKRDKLVSPPIVYVKGEEMTRYVGQLMISKWIEPHIDISSWEFYDLSCKTRDNTNDQILKDVIEAGKRIRSIFKEPTITPTEDQIKSLNLSGPLPSPNGAMRKGWNGITISRDTIHLDGIDLGYKDPVMFERHAVGGEYEAGWKQVNKGKVITTFYPDNPNDYPVIVDHRRLHNEKNVVVVYHNPLDNVAKLADQFFERTLKAGITPYVVTKKTVFKWQEEFWNIHKRVFKEKYESKFKEKGLLKETGGELKHIISDAATIQIIKWNKGGFGMSAHNYDGDMLTDEVAQVHRSPGFVTSNLIGENEDGAIIKEFEASHGTVTDMWNAHLNGKNTSFNPLGMAEALLGALTYSSVTHQSKEDSIQMENFINTLRNSINFCFKIGKGTKDISGSNGLTTEEFIEKVCFYMKNGIPNEEHNHNVINIGEEDIKAQVDIKKIEEMFNDFDIDKNGSINKEEFTKMMVKLRLAPLLIE